MVKSNVIDFAKVQRKGRLKDMFRKQEGECFYCGEPMTLSLGFNNTAEIEHVFPKSKGGKKDKFNEVAAGRACNQFKADKPAYAVMSTLRRLKLCGSTMTQSEIAQFAKER